MKEAVPEGIDVYFDNTGGEIFETCLFAMKNFGALLAAGLSHSTTARAAARTAGYSGPDCYKASDATRFRGDGL